MNFILFIKLTKLRRVFILTLLLNLQNFNAAIAQSNGELPDKKRYSSGTDLECK